MKYKQFLGNVGFIGKFYIFVNSFCIIYRIKLFNLVKIIINFVVKWAFLAGFKWENISFLNSFMSFLEEWKMSLNFLAFFSFLSCGYEKDDKNVLNFSSSKKL